MPRARPSATERAFEAGWRALRAGHYERAAAAFDRAVSFDPGDALAEDALYWRALALARSGRTSAARRAMGDFIERYPGSARTGELSVMLGWSLLETGDTEKARSHFQRAVTHTSKRVRDAARQGLRAIEQSSR
ncbi:MAG: tetratricopeptide repeat protein [Proteobacteria bacterium]|nr:tetratricopeptide repeat protein [Pseudomonadota bacterium]